MAENQRIFNGLRRNSILVGFFFGRVIATGLLPLVAVDQVGIVINDPDGGVASGVRVDPADQELTPLAHADAVFDHHRYVPAQVTGLAALDDAPVSDHPVPSPL